MSESAWKVVSKWGKYGAKTVLQNEAVLSEKRGEQVSGPVDSNSQMVGGDHHVFRDKVLRGNSQTGIGV